MRSIFGKFIGRGICLALVVLFSGCSQEERSKPPDILRLGVLPDEQPDMLRQRYGPLVAHLSQEMDQKVELVIPEDYGDLIDLFGSGAVDMAYLGGTTFVAARAEHDAVPLVMRDIDAEFSTYLLARADAPEQEIKQFRGRSFAFGSELSTSGHLMPRYFLGELDIAPENFFESIQYSGAHDSTVHWVRDGLADLGAVNAEVFETMLRDGRLEPGVLRIVWQTPPYTNYVWAIQPSWDVSYVNRLRDTFLGLSMLDENQAEILRRMGARGFLPANQSEFSRLREVMSGLPQFQALIETEPK